MMALDHLKQLGGRLPWHRWLYPGKTPVVVVLMYHDVCVDGDLANWLRVPISRFEAQLDTLAAIGEFIAPSALAEPSCLAVDRLSFLVTFDDGYRNNLLLAAPILERRRISAFYFISTGPLESRLPFWTDIVITPVQALGLASLDLARFGLGRFEFAKTDPAARWEEVQRMLVAIKSRGNEDDPSVTRVLDWFRGEFEQVLAEHLPRFAPLAPAEVAHMARSGFCTIGSHGHEHRALTRVTDAALASSLAISRSVLGEIAGTQVDDVAYPNGDHDQRVTAAAAAAGYKRGYIVRAAPVAGRQPALALPRLAVGAFDSPALLRFKLAKLLWPVARRRSLSARLELT